MNLTLSSCFYVLNTKHDMNSYKEWISNFFQMITDCNIVIYTDEKSLEYIPKTEKENIKIILKNIEEFSTYHYKEKWIENHDKNHLLKDKVEWKVNMLWCEKIMFVNETIEKKYYNTEFYGWCDIGYFRNRPNDVHTNFLLSWPNKNKIENLKKDKIYYGCVNSNTESIQFLKNIIQNKNIYKLPSRPIPDNQVSVAGNFFVCHKKKITKLKHMFYDTLFLYFTHDYLIKDDQIILADIIFTNPHEFEICVENVPVYDTWFMFQRILL